MDRFNFVKLNHSTTGIAEWHAKPLCELGVLSRSTLATLPTMDPSPGGTKQRPSLNSRHLLSLDSALQLKNSSHENKNALMLAKTGDIEVIRHFNVVNIIDIKYNPKTRTSKYIHQNVMYIINLDYKRM